MTTLTLLSRPRGCVLPADDDHAVFSTGSSLVLFNLRRPHEAIVVRGDENCTVAAFASNETSRQLAYAMNGSAHDICITTFGGDLIVTVHRNSLFGCTSLDFSQSGRIISAVSGIGAQTMLELWQITGATSSMVASFLPPCGLTFSAKFLSFNPFSQDIILLGDAHCLHFFQLKPAHPESAIQVTLENTVECSELDCHNKQCNMSFSASVLSSSVAATPTVTAICWGSSSVLRVATSCRLMEIDILSGSTVRSVQLVNMHIVPSAVSALVEVSEFIVAAMSDGTCIWLSRLTLCCEHKLKIAGDIGRYDDGSVVSCKLVPSGLHLLIATSDGLVRVLPSHYKSPTDFGAACSEGLFASHHAGLVTSTAAVPLHYEAIATADYDGHVKIWSCNQGTHMSHFFWRRYHNFNASLITTYSPAHSTETSNCGIDAVPVTCLCGHHKLSLLLVGLKTGSLFALQCSSNAMTDGLDKGNDGMLSVNSHLKVYKDAITVICLHPQRSCMVVGSLHSSTLYLIELQSQSHLACNVIGSAEVNSNPLTVMWHDNRLLVSTSAGSVFCLDVDAVTSHSSPFERTPFTWKTKIEGVLTHFCQLRSEESLALYAISSKGPGAVAIKATDSGALSIVDVCRSADTPSVPVICIAPSQSRRCLAVGDARGMLSMWSVSAVTNHPSAKLMSINVHACQITNIVFTKSSQFLVTTSIDGSAFITELPGTGQNRLTPIPASVKLSICQVHNTSSTEVSDGEASDGFPNVVPPGSLSKDVDERRHALGGRIADLRHMLASMIAANEGSTSLEKLSRHEFVVDCHGHDNLMEANKVRLSEVRRQLMEEDRDRVDISSRIMKKCWDAMAAPALQCEGLSQGTPSVLNFPLPHRTKHMIRQGQCMQVLRKTELLDTPDSQYSDPVRDGSPVQTEELSWVINESASLSTYGLGTNPVALRLRQCPVSHAECEDKDIHDKSLLSSTQSCTHAPAIPMYSSITLVTVNQWRLQIKLIATLIRHYQVVFNQKFDELMQKKARAVNKISQKISQFKEVATDSCLDDFSLRPEFDTMGSPGSFLNILCSKDGTLQGKARDFEQPMDAACQRPRAIHDMMDDSLEVPYQNDKSIKSVPAANMQVSTSSRNLGDRVCQDLQACELLTKASVDETDKRRSNSKLEVHKLRVEIQEAARAFDENVETMFIERIKVLQTISVQEYALLRLACQIVRREQACSTHLKLQSQQRTLSHKLSKLLLSAEHVKNCVQSTTASLEHLEQENRRQGSSMLPKIHSADDALNGTVIASGNSTTTQKEQHGVGPPVKPIESRGDHKMKTEGTLSTMALLNKELASKQVVLEMEAVTYQTTIESLAVRQFHVQRLYRELDDNCEVLVQLRQGQDEVEQEAVVTDYSDAVLLPIKAVHRINTAILNLGSEQVKLLSRTEDFKKCIRCLEWENNFLHEQSHDVKEHFTDLQLLHVTRNLQGVLDSGESTGVLQPETRRENVVRRQVEHKSKPWQRILQKNLSNTQRRLAQYNSENDRLRVHIRRQRAVVATFEPNAGSKEGNIMKCVVMRRRLMDVARLQTEEIDFLKQELERLRQRTYPVFGLPVFGDPLRARNSVQ